MLDTVQVMKPYVQPLLALTTVMLALHCGSRKSVVRDRRMTARADLVGRYERQEGVYRFTQYAGAFLAVMMIGMATKDHDFVIIGQQASEWVASSAAAAE